MRRDFFSTIGEILKYGGSTFAALVVNSIYTVTDGFFVGNWVGSDGLEALALVFPVVVIFNALSCIFELGGSAVVSENIGSGKINLAEKIIRTNYVCAIVVGVITAIVGNIFVEPIFYMIVSSPEQTKIIDMAIGFVRIILCGLPFLLIILSTGAFMRCLDHPTHVVYLLGATSVTNIILDTLFIVVFGWGVTGAATATVLAEIFGTIISLWYFKFSRQKLKSPSGFSSLGYFWQECKVGAGFAVSALMMCALEYFTNYILLYYDASDLLAAATISNMILSLVYLPLNGMDVGTQPLLSRLYAAKQIQQCAYVMRCNFILTIIMVTIIYAGLMIFTEEIVRFFVSNDEVIPPNVILFLRFSFLLQPFVGISTWLSGIMAALEEEWRNLVVGLLPVVVQVPLIILLPMFLPIEYIGLNFSALDLADAAVSFVLIRPFLREKGLSFKKIFKS